VNLYVRFTSFFFQINADTHEDNEKYHQLKQKRGYDYSDRLTVSKDTLPEYDKKVGILSL